MWYFFSSRCCVYEEGYIHGLCYDNKDCIVICPTDGSPWSKACAAFLLAYLFITLMKSSKKTDEQNKIFFKTFRNDSYVKIVVIMYNLLIEFTVSIITYILFVSSSNPADLLINTMAVNFITDIDEFLAFTIQKDLTVSIIREYIWSEIDNKKKAIKLEIFKVLVNKRAKYIFKILAN